MRLKYLGILILLLIPLFGVVGYIISRSIITPNDQFFEINKGETPNININDWSLTIEGLVDNSMIFKYSNFTTLPFHEILATIQCVDGPSGTAVWKGVLIKDLLDLAGVKKSAFDVVFYAADDYSSSLTIGEIYNDDVLLAYEMNNEQLPVEQGYPVRIVAPNQLGYKWVKWVVRIEIVDFDYLGYWESRGWNDDASITPLSDWIWHALLLSISFPLGGLAMMSGLKRSRITGFFDDLPKFMNKKFHIAVGMCYVITSISIFVYWIILTFLNRGTIFTTIHGIIALLSVILVIPGAITGIKKIKKCKNKEDNTIHYKLNLYSFYLFLATIILGFLLVFFNFLRIY